MGVRGPRGWGPKKRVEYSRCSDGGFFRLFCARSRDRTGTGTDRPSTPQADEQVQEFQNAQEITRRYRARPMRGTMESKPPWFTTG